MAFERSQSDAPLRNFTPAWVYGVLHQYVAICLFLKTVLHRGGLGWWRYVLSVRMEVSIGWQTFVWLYVLQRSALCPCYHIHADTSVDSSLYASSLHTINEAAQTHHAFNGLLSWSAYHAEE